MTYSVVWAKSAEDRLAILWMEAEDRQDVADAADAIDAALKSDPHHQGESRDATRLTFIPPLVALFEIHDADRLVRVLQIDRFGG